MHIHTSDQEALALGFGGYCCNWGVHLCGFYETEEERDEIICGFLHQGDLDGDLQLYCPVEQNSERFRQTYRHRFPDGGTNLDDPDRFRIQSARELYYPDGTFSPLAMDEGLEAFFEESQRNGPRNIRGTAEMAWALEAIPGAEHLMAYESRLNYFIPGKPWISICLYNLARFSGAQIMQALQTHPYAISGGVITENPFFRDPDEWLAANAPQFLPGAVPP
ncbi:MAG: MEDS domain-containing protein [Desulfococcaceae bacterium]